MQDCLPLINILLFCFRMSFIKPAPLSVYLSQLCDFSMLNKKFSTTALKGAASP